MVRRISPRQADQEKTTDHVDSGARFAAAAQVVDCFDFFLPSGKTHCDTLSSSENGRASMR
jgi:hypothetical protein